VWLTWRTAMEQALYGTAGFYRRGEHPDAHFRTSVHASTRFAGALATLLSEIDVVLGSPERIDVVDVGAGKGELLGQLTAALQPELATRVRAQAVEVAPRPATLPDHIGWAAAPPKDITGLVVANEWLDNVPLDVVELALDGPRLVMVNPVTGAERLGDPPSAGDRGWLARWWPLREVGDRAEVGAPRCQLWAETVGRLRRGVALAIDYGHERACRPTSGTLSAYLDGHVVPAVPNGTCDLTAHVALDACAVAGTAAGASTTVLTTQRACLRSLGLSGSRPALELARTNPREYLQALRAAGEDAELTDPTGLGSFGWLAQAVGVPLPDPLTRA
jgi:SAM-dependent MidA family methyltransferase